VAFSGSLAAAYTVLEQSAAIIVTIAKWKRAVFTLLMILPFRIDPTAKIGGVIVKTRLLVVQFFAYRE
jgi:hypothetical protein